MDNKGITKKQFRAQMVMYCIYLLMAAVWTYMGISDGSLFMAILGGLYFVFVVVALVLLVRQRKLHTVENPEVDKQMVKGMKGSAIMLGILALGFLLAFGLAAIFKH